MLRLLAFFAALTVAGGLEFSIMHCGDSMGKFNGVDENLSGCTKMLREQGKCLGGLARVATILKQYRRSHAEQLKTELLALNLGNELTGSVWSYTDEQDRAAIVNMVEFNVSNIGDNDFEVGVELLKSYTSRIESALVSTNSDLVSTHVHRSYVVTINGTKVGLLGLAATDSLQRASRDVVRLFPVLVSAREEAKKLRSRGVKIILAMVSGCLKLAMQIAREITDVSVVVGAGDGVLLCNKNCPNDTELKRGPYPIWETSKFGNKVALLHTYVALQYVGYATLVFDKNYRLVRATGDQIYVSQSVPEDPELAEIINNWSDDLDTLRTKVVGKSLTYLDSTVETCCHEECNVGNMVADAYVDDVARRSGGELTRASVGLAIPATFGHSFTPHSGHREITEEHLRALIPAETVISVASVSGEILKNVLEISATPDRYECGRGFLQVSGLQVHYRIDDKQAKVESLMVMCGNCRVPEYRPLDMDARYNVVLPQFLLHGGFEQRNLRLMHGCETRLASTGAMMVRNYISRRGVVFPEVEGRITVTKVESWAPGGSAPSASLCACAVAALLIRTSLLCCVSVVWSPSESARCILKV